MGNKAEITTLDGMRKAAHAMVDDLFNRLPANPDGTPVDNVRLHHERPFERPSEGGAILQTGELVGFEVRFARPVITPAVGSRLVLRTREGTFVLAHQSRESLTSLIRFMVDVLGGLTEYEIVERMDRGTVLFTDMSIAEISRRSNLLFEPVGDPVGQPVIETAPEPDDTAAQVRLAAEKEQAEQEARERAEKAEAEAREAEERRLAEEKRAEDNTQQLTPETLAELREESRAEQPSATDLEGAVAEDVVDTEDRRFAEDAAATEPMPEAEEPTAEESAPATEETKTKSKRKKS